MIVLIFNYLLIQKLVKRRLGYSYKIISDVVDDWEASQTAATSTSTSATSTSSTSASASATSTSSTSAGASTTSISISKTTIPKSSRVLREVGAFMTNRSEGGDATTASDMLSFFVQNNIITPPTDRKYAARRKLLLSIHRYFVTNGFKLDKSAHVNSYIEKDRIRFGRDDYISTIMDNRSRSPSQRLREVYVSESCIDQHYKRFRDDIFDGNDGNEDNEEEEEEDDEEDGDVINRSTAISHSNERLCFAAAIRGPNPSSACDSASQSSGDKSGLVPNTFWYYIGGGGGGGSKGDKRKRGFNRRNFIKWFSESLLPNLTEPSIIIMDSKYYHTTTRRDGARNVSSMTKSEVLAFLRRINVACSESDMISDLKKRAKDWIRHNIRPAVVEIAEQRGHYVMCSLPLLFTRTCSQWTSFGRMPRGI